MKRKILKQLRNTIIVCFLLFNIIAFNQAYRFTHFDDQIDIKTKPPEELGFGEKLETLLLGVNMPKPKNAVLPSHEFETIFLQSEEKLESWFIEVEDEKGVVILFHGFASSKSTLLPYAYEFNQKGYSTLLVDFMGSGGSSGKATTVGYSESEDVIVAYNYIKALKPSGELVLFGSSMGAVAILKALSNAEIEPSKVILECPFGRFKDTVKKRFEAMRLPSFPLAEILMVHGGLQLGFNPFHHNPTDYASEIETESLLLYGSKDNRVDRHEVDEIFNNLKGSKTLGILENSGHELYLNHDAEKWHALIDVFLD